MLVLIGGFVVRRAIVVAFEPFGMFRSGTAEGEEMHALGQFDIVGQGYHHIVDDMDGHGGQIRHSTSAIVAGTQSIEGACEVGSVFAGKNGGGIGIFVAFCLAVRQVDTGKEAPGIVAVRIERRTAVAIDEGALFVKKTEILLKSGHGESDWSGETIGTWHRTTQRRAGCRAPKALTAPVLP